jgi:hypothetical protein
MRRRAAEEIPPEKLDWSQLIEPGALVVWGQASAEPASLASPAVTFA